MVIEKLDVAPMFLIRSFVCMIAIVFGALLLMVAEAGALETHEMHRLYNPNSGEHFYTADSAERDALVDNGWSYEGVGWYAPASSNTPVYRLYNANGGEHHYTMSTDERDSLVSIGWSDEGTGWYSSDEKSVTVYRDYNPNAFANNHNYTTSEDEHANLISMGWRSEGKAWYAFAAPSSSDNQQEPYSQRYSYEIYWLNKAYDQPLTNTRSPIFIKTDNPRLETVGLYCGVHDVYGYTGHDYDDIRYAPTEDDSRWKYRNDLYRVSGGYVCDIMMREPGRKTIEIREYREDRRITQSYTNTPSTAVEGVDYASAGTFEMTFADYNEMKDAWQEGVIAANCTEDMDPLQKMEAVTRYLIFDSEFEYPIIKDKESGGGYANCAQYPSSPYFATKRWNSFTSPAALCDLAERIGGFDEIHNCYGDYPIGSSDWYRWHSKCRVTYKGEYHYFECCPSSNDRFTEDMMIDFGDTSGMLKLYG